MGAEKLAPEWVKACRAQFPDGVTMAELQQHFVDNMHEDAKTCIKSLKNYDLPLLQRQAKAAEEKKKEEAKKKKEEEEAAKKREEEEAAKKKERKRKLRRKKKDKEAGDEDDNKEASDSSGKLGENSSESTVPPKG